MAKDDDILGGLGDIFDDFDDEKDVKVSEEKKPVIPEDETVDEGEIKDVPGQLNVDIYETDEKLIIKARTAGVKKSDLDLNISNGVLKIHGLIPNSEEVDVVKWWAQECFWGEFDREIVLPVQVVDGEVEAVLRDGILTITFTKVNLDEATKIHVL